MITLIYTQMKHLKNTKPNGKFGYPNPLHYIYDNKKIKNMIKESQLVRDFKMYIATTGLKAVKVWENKRGVFAQINGWTDKNNPHFSNVMQGGTVVSLSFEDIKKRSN